MTSAIDMSTQLFVSLTTFRRSGAAVSTPVWISSFEGSAAVWTPRDSGKVKRLRIDPRLEMRPCDRVGNLVRSAPVVAGTARIVDDPDVVETVRASIEHKYGPNYHLVMSMEGYPVPGSRVIILVTDATGTAPLPS